MTQIEFETTVNGIGRITIPARMDAPFIFKKVIVKITTTDDMDKAREQSQDMEETITHMDVMVVV